jgi:hypothetical protein
MGKEQEELSGGWIRLSEGVKVCPPVYRLSEPDHDIGYESPMHTSPQEFSWIRMETSELANIPWVKALIRAARREVQHKEGIHERADVEYDTNRGDVDNALDNVLPYREDDECLDGLIAALKPFAGVDYE